MFWFDLVYRIGLFISISQQLMGNANLQIQNQLEFVQNLEDKNFGEIQIFKSVEGAYIMKLDRNHVKGDLNQQTFKNIIQYTILKECKYLIPIVHIATHQQNGLCLVYERTSIFTQYYNHTLADMLKNKKVFEEPELWFILENMLKLITQLKENQLGINLQLGNVFLTLKGLPCVSHYHLYSTANSISCCQADMSQLLAKTVIELVLGRQLSEVEVISESKEMIESLGKVCSRHKTLGRVVKELLKKEKSERDILDDIQEFQADGKIKIANQIKLTRYKYVIPENIPQNQQQMELPHQKNGGKATEHCSKSSQIAETLKKAKERRPTEEPRSIETKQKRKGSSTASKKHKEISQPPTLGDFLSKNNILMSKEESTKILNDLQKRKQEYQVQMARFKMRKEELLCQSQNQNLEASRPVFRNTQQKKSKAKLQSDDLKKKKVEPSHHSYNTRIR